MTNIFITRRAFLTESLDLKNSSLGECLVQQELITNHQLEFVMVRTGLKLKQFYRDNTSIFILNFMIFNFVIFPLPKMQG